MEFHDGYAEKSIGELLGIVLICFLIGLVLVTK
jgi:hypothetical protein